MKRVRCASNWRGAQNVSKSDLKRLHSVHSYRHESNLLSLLPLLLLLSFLILLFTVSATATVVRDTLAATKVYGLRAHLVTAAAN
jgi:hypothetical protein